ncbi:hypothetical protein Gohar_000174, partial [Gossypium harknessii]|nr:hypothetical protein [Gossypium harknessii]
MVANVVAALFINLVLIHALLPSPLNLLVVPGSALLLLLPTVAWNASFPLREEHSATVHQSSHPSMHSQILLIKEENFGGVGKLSGSWLVGLVRRDLRD